MKARLPLVVIRPEPGNAATLAAAKARGLDAFGFPLFEIAPVGWTLPAGNFQALLAGSANIFRHGGLGLQAIRHLPVIAVGASTADAARACGFGVSHVGAGGLQPVVETIEPGVYLRLAGQEHVDLSPPQGVRIETAVVYAARPVALPPLLHTLLATEAVLLLHSGEAARHFRAQCEHVELPKDNIHLACLAPRIAELAGSGWAEVAVAASRTDADLLELATTMCQRV